MEKIKWLHGGLLGRRHYLLGCQESSVIPAPRLVTVTACRTSSAPF